MWRLGEGAGVGVWRLLVCVRVQGVGVEAGHMCVCGCIGGHVCVMVQGWARSGWGGHVEAGVGM